MSDPIPVSPVSVMPAISQPHVPPPDDREPKTRPKIMFFDRVKILVILAVILGFAIVKQHSDIPIMTWGDAIDRQVRAKRWIFVVGAVEIVRQIHLLISERSIRYHQFFKKKVWGRWDSFVGRRNPWLRFRVARAVKYAVFGALFILLCSTLIWHISFVDGVIEAPTRISDFLFGQAAGLPFIVQIMFSLVLVVLQFAALFFFMSRGGVDTYMPQEIKTRFDDVWGQDNVLDQVRENIVFLDKPEELESKGGHVPGGILLWGPPGTGKTLMAEAMAGETGRPYVFVDPGAFNAMFFGVGVLKVKSLFRKLRKLALRFGGVIVFFDEADVLGSRGGQVSNIERNTAEDPIFGANACNGISYLSSHAQWHLFQSSMQSWPQIPDGRSRIKQIMMPRMGGGSMGELQALLTEMSGLKKPRGFINRRIRAFLNMAPKQPPKYRILTVMATNMPSSLDPALLRPGRLDRQYRVGYPSKAGRVKTYEGYFNKIKHAVTPQQIDKLATMGPYETGATIKDLVNEALIVAIRKGRDFVTWPDVIEARTLKRVGPGDMGEYVDRDRHHIAIHEACHAVMALRVMKGHDIDIATIERRGDVGGFVAPIPIDDRWSEWRSTMDNDVLTSLASLAGEKLFFDGDNSSGVGGDLRSATSMVLAMESYWGMGETISSQLADKRQDELSVNGAMLRGPLGARVEKRLQALFEKATQIIAENRFEVLAVAHALEQHKTITGEDIAAIVNGYPGPLVDGRPYHSPQFIEMAEKYHTKVLEAHQSQGKVDMALPVWVNSPVRVEVAPGPSWSNGHSNSANGANGNGGYAEPGGWPTAAAPPPVSSADDPPPTIIIAPPTAPPPPPTNE